MHPNSEIVPGPRFRFLTPFPRPASHVCFQDSGRLFCKSLVKFSDAATYRDALREVEERLTGSQNPLKSNFAAQFDQEKPTASQIVLVAGGLPSKVKPSWSLDQRHSQ